MEPVSTGIYRANYSGKNSAEEYEYGVGLLLNKTPASSAANRSTKEFSLFI